MIHKWSMINVHAESNPAFEYLKSIMAGVSHDGDNLVFTITPPAELLEGREQQLTKDDSLTDLENRVSMIRQFAVFMSSESSTVLTGDRSYFKALYNTPEHRLWCEKHKSKEDFEADFLEVFGAEVGETTQAEAAQMIKQYFTATQ